MRAEDARQLADAIKATLAENKATRRMSAGGRELVERDHGLEHMLDRLESVYARYLKPA